MTTCKNCDTVYSPAHPALGVPPLCPRCHDADPADAVQPSDLAGLAARESGVRFDPKWFHAPGGVPIGGWPLADKAVDRKQVTDSQLRTAAEVAAQDPLYQPIADQPPPRPGRGDMWALVIEDMKQRREVGIERYNTPLQIGNGRKMLEDAFAEVLDLAVYLRGEIEERRELEAEVERLRAMVHEAVAACDEIADALGSPATWLDGLEAARALRAENERLKADLHHARCLVKILAHSYEHDSRPPAGVVSEAMQYDATKPPQAAKEQP